DKGASGAKGFTQRADQHLHVIDSQAMLFDYAATGGAEAAKTMGVIHHDPGAMLAGGSADLRQPGEIAVHAEHTVGDHQRITASLAQTLRQTLWIVMQIAGESRTTEQPGIQQGCMIEPVL